MRYSKWIQEQARVGEASVPSVGGGELLAGEGGADPESLAEFEQLLEDTAGEVRGPRGMEVAEGLELEGASGQLGKHGRMIFLWAIFPMFLLPGPEPAKKRLKSQPISGDTPSSPMYLQALPSFRVRVLLQHLGVLVDRLVWLLQGADILRSVNVPISLGMKLERCFLLTMMMIAQV